MSTLSKARVSAYALNSQANRIAQTNPELAAALRMQAAYGSQLPVASKVSTKKETVQVKKSVQLLNSKANITYTRTVIGTLETTVGSEGAIVNDGQIGRGGGASITDDVFIMEFNAFSTSRGG